MKLLRYGPPGEEKPGLLDPNGVLRDLSPVTLDFRGDTVSLRALDRLRALNIATLAPVEDAPRIGACLADAPNVFAIGLNYKRHAAEVGAKPPPEPILFSKATSAISGPNDDVVIPRDSEKCDWEVELTVVIGREASYVSEADALDCVAGYCVMNDVSERAFQIEHKGQWIKGKSAPTFAPIGPWLVTPEEIDDPQNLDLWLEVNGETAQRSNTSDMIFGVAEIISYMSRFMTLRVGDVIATGTPEGVGMGMSPQRFLKPGDEMRLGVKGLGQQRQRVRAYSAPQG